MKGTEKVLEGRARAVAKNAAFRAYKNQYVILFTDRDTGLKFALCNLVQGEAGPEWVLDSASQKTLQRAIRHPEFVQHWFGYAPEVIRYETLADFPDHHRRQHWRWETCVLFVGTVEEMSWISTVTMKGNGLAFDKKSGLFIPKRSLKEARPNGAR